jgi:DNA-binding NarL/FixJ family response regulator
MREPGTMPVRCVIVDDNRDFLRAASDLLERAGITVVGVAQTGGQAGRACGDLQPDVVLVDIELGEESGFDVARQLTGEVGPTKLYVILTSAHSAEDFADMMADTPAVSFLPKSALSGPAVLGILAGARQASSRRHRDSR